MERLLVCVKRARERRPLAACLWIWARWGSHGIRQVVLLFGIAGFAQAATAVPETGAFDCLHGDCGGMMDGPYPNLVVGTIDAIATREETAQVFRELRKRGWWKALPDDVGEFVHHVQPVSVEVASGRRITMLMATEEMREAPMQVGDLARFAPHSNFNTRPPHPEDPYWVAVGCIAKLCDRTDDACKSGYHQAIYHLPDGHELDASGMSLLAGGTTVDNQTMKPVGRQAPASN